MTSRISPALVEPGASHQPVLHSLVQAGLFERPRLGVHPVHHGAVAQLEAVLAGQSLDLLDDAGRFLFFVVRLSHLYRHARGVVGEQLVVQPLPV